MAATPYLTKTGLQYLWGRITALFQLKEAGKGLSTNDYTNADKAEVAKIAALVAEGGEPNVIEGVTVNGTDAAITGKKAVIAVPTKTSDLSNDSGFLTATDIAGKADAATTYTKTETDAAITTALSGITGIRVEKPTGDALPATGEAGVIYLIPNGGASGNGHDEYIWFNNAFEKIGTTDIDLSGYLRTSDITAVTTAEIDEITGAGA